MGPLARTGEVGSVLPAVAHLRGVDPVGTALVVLVSLVVAEQARVVVADRLGATAVRRSGRLWALHRRVEIIGTVVVPSVVALAFHGVAAHGWAARTTLRLEELPRARRVLVALTPPTTHLAIAAALLWLRVGASAQLSVEHDVLLLVWGSCNVALAVLGLLPLPGQPGGIALGALTGGERWARLNRAHRGVAGLPLALLAGWALEGMLAAPLV